MKRILLAFLFLAIGLSAQSTKVGGAGTTKVGGTGTSKVSPYSSGSSGNAWTFIGSGAEDAHNQITTGVPAAGNLIVVFIKTEGADHITGATRGTDTYSLGNVSTHANGLVRCMFLYFLSAADASTSVVTFTTSGADVTFQQIVYWNFSASGTHSLDANPTGSTGTSATGVINSGTYTTSVSTGLALGGYGAYSANTVSAMKVGSNTATGSLNSQESYSWYYLFSSTLTGVTSNCLLTGSSADWTMSGISFKSL